MDIAIVGGGLCGLALAIALTKRNVPYQLYESRSSFTEIGAGINIGPNALQAFQAIDPVLGDAVLKLCSRNPSPEVWMQLRYGAPTADHADHELITELLAPPTGNMTVHRNDLLRLLANHVDVKASFNKKLVSVEQNGILHFADGTTAKHNLVIACDGIHSSVRKSILEGDAAIPHYVGDGVYRALLPIENVEPLLRDITSRMIFGPDGVVVMYPVAGGENMNIGFWTNKKIHNPEWVKPHQRDEMLKDFADWGPLIHKIMDLMPDPSFWAAHSHLVQPEKSYVGRVCLIGDAAHSMPPHQGAGGGQAMEDAYVLAEVFAIAQDEAALEAFDAIRRPRSQQVLETSVEAMHVWSGFDAIQADPEKFKKDAEDRFACIWNHDVAADGRAVVEKYRSIVAGRQQGSLDLQYD